jgi:hypothetical protein
MYDILVIRVLLLVIKFNFSTSRDVQCWDALLLHIIIMCLHLNVCTIPPLLTLLGVILDIIIKVSVRPYFALPKSR